MIRQQEDDTALMRTHWRCSACGSLNSMEHDNVCGPCMDKALGLDAEKLLSFSPHNRDTTTDGAA